jgi:hypothetical protein
VTDRLDGERRDEIAALLGMGDIPPLVERRRRPVHANTINRRLDTEIRYCVLVIALADTEQAMTRLRPLVSGVVGIAYDLTARDAIKRAADVAALA